MSRKMTLERINDYPQTVYKDGETLRKFVMCKETSPVDWENHIVVYAGRTCDVDQVLRQLHLSAIDWWFMDHTRNYLEIY